MCPYNINLTNALVICFTVFQQSASVCILSVWILSGQTETRPSFIYMLASRVPTYAIYAYLTSGKKTRARV